MSKRTTPALTKSIATADAAPLIAHTSLADMPEPDLLAMATGLDKSREQFDSMSGVCATLAGLVLAEIKKRVGHGNWETWLKEHFPKSLTTAKTYIRLASVFTKSAPRCRFEQMTLALMDAGQPQSALSLDTTHPVVGAVTKWTKGRTFYQLREDELRTGGNHHPECPHCGGDLKSKSQEICPHCGESTGEKEPTPEEQREQLVSLLRDWASSHTGDDRIARKLWRLLPDHETQALAAHFRTVARDMDEWLKTPAKRREEMSIEEVLA